MAHTKTSPGTAPSAAHAAPDPAPAPGTPAAADSPAAAVHAALAANPGSTVAVIADAAGTGKPAARAALLEMEQAGTTTRIKGTRPGIPDTWTLTGPAPDTASRAPDPQTGQAGQPGENPDGNPPDGEAEDETAGDTRPDGTAGTDHPATPGPETAEPTSHDAPAGDAVAAEQDNRAAPGSDPDDDQDTPADADSEAAGKPDPALVTKLTEHLDQIKAAAGELDLTASADLKTVLAGLDEIADQAAQARRELKAAIGGRKAPVVRPGGLRDKVLAHLAAHPGTEFTPHDIHKVLGHSSGAIANALDTLVKLGEAEVATEKPRKFRRAAQPAEASTPTTDGTDKTDSTKQDGTDLAGAA